MTRGKRIHVKSKYKCVRGIKNMYHDKIYWTVHIKGVGSNGFNTEREAAIAVDKYFIKKGKPPVNILKPITR